MIHKRVQQAQNSPIVSNGLILWHRELSKITVDDAIGSVSRETRPTSCLLGNGTYKITFLDALKGKYVRYQRCDDFSAGEYVTSDTAIDAESGDWTIPSERIKNITVHTASNGLDANLAFYKCTGLTRTELYDCLNAETPIHATLSSASAWSNTFNPLVTNWSNAEGYRLSGAYYIPKRIDQNLSATGEALTHTGTAKHNAQILGACLQNLNETTAKGFKATLGTNLTLTGTEDFTIAFNFIWDGNYISNLLGFFCSATTNKLFGKFYYEVSPPKISLDYINASGTTVGTKVTLASPLIARTKYFLVVTRTGATPIKIFISDGTNIVSTAFSGANDGSSFQGSTAGFIFGMLTAAYIFHGRMWNFFIKYGTGAGIASGHHTIESLLSVLPTPNHLFPCQEGYYNETGSVTNVYDVAGTNHATLAKIGTKDLTLCSGIQQYDNYNLTHGYRRYYRSGYPDRQVPYTLAGADINPNPPTDWTKGALFPAVSGKHNLANGGIKFARSSRVVGLGMELIPNPSFNSWVGTANPNNVPVGWAVSSNDATNYVEPVSAGAGLHFNVSNAALQITIPIQVYLGKTYLVKMNCTRIASGSAGIYLGALATTDRLSIYSVGSFSAIISPSANGTVLIKRLTTGANDIDISFASVKEILNYSTTGIGTAYAYPSGELQEQFFNKDAVVGNGQGYPEIWNSTIRDSVCYDSTDPFKWNLNELNQAYIQSYITEAYDDMLYILTSTDGYIDWIKLYSEPKTYIETEQLLKDSIEDYPEFSLLANETAHSYDDAGLSLKTYT